MSDAPKPQFALSDHCDGTRFFNPGVKTNKTFLQLLKWQLGGGRRRWPEWVDDTFSPELPASISPREAYVTLVNHATLLVQTHNMCVLTDPVFSLRVSPLGWIGPKRARQPGMQVDELPALDAVVVSHNHYDHLDLPSLTKIHQRFADLPFIVPLGNARYLKALEGARIVELDWWQSHALPSGASITLVPAQHWSRRTARDTNQALWGGFVMVSNPHVQVYFTGDTGYGPHFKEIRARLGAPSLSLLPIGAYKPRWFMKEQHMNPEDSVKAHLDLGTQMSIAMHFGTFQLTDEGIEEPPRDLRECLKEQKPSAPFVVPRNGQTLRFEAQAGEIGA